MEPKEIAKLITEDIRINNGLILEKDPSVRTTATPTTPTAEPPVEPAVEAPPEEVEKAKAQELKAVDPLEEFKKVAQNFVIQVYRNFPDPAKAYKRAREKYGLKFSGTQSRKILLRGKANEVYGEFDPFDKNSPRKAAVIISDYHKETTLPPETKQNMRDVFVKQFNTAMGKNMSAARNMGITIRQVGPDEFEIEIPINYKWDEGETAADDIQKLMGIIKPEAEVAGARKTSLAQINRAAQRGEYQVGL